MGHTVPMDIDGSLTNQLLIAMPGMLDPNFHTTVTLICEHNDDGALGIVINRPLTLKMSGLFEQLDLADPDPDEADRPGHDGRPGRDRSAASCCTTRRALSKTRLLSPGHPVDAVSRRDRCHGGGDGPEHSLVALGYAGWDPGQLETRCLPTPGSTYPATPEIVFDMPFEQRWVSAAETLGIDISQMSPDAGHA